VVRGLSPILLLSVLAASAALAGCGAGSRSATERTHSLTIGSTSTSVIRGAGASTGRRQPGAQPLTHEEMREYDANEGRCEEDGGRVRDVGTMEAYCSFAARSNNFHLIESSHEKEPAGEEE
jgi:ABC-type phosphate transport system substrate-binding protein